MSKKNVLKRNEEGHSRAALVSLFYTM